MDSDLTVELMVRQIHSRLSAQERAIDHARAELFIALDEGTNGDTTVALLASRYRIEHAKHLELEFIATRAAQMARGGDAWLLTRYVTEILAAFNRWRAWLPNSPQELER